MSKSAKFGSSKKHMFSRDIAYKVSILMPHPIKDTPVGRGLIGNSMQE